MKIYDDQAAVGWTESQIKGFKGNLNSKTRLVLSFIVFRILLDVAYVYFVSNNWGGFNLEINSGKYLESLMLLLVPLLFLPGRSGRPSVFLFCFLYLIVGLPISSMYGLQSESRLYAYFIAFSFLSIILSSRISTKKWNLRTVSCGHDIVLVSTTVIGCLFFIWIFYKGGLSLFNLDFRNVYDYRDQLGTDIYFGKISLVRELFAQVLVPGLVTVFLWRRKFVLMVMMLFIQLLLFGFTGHKAYLIYPLMPLFVFYFRNSKEMSLVLLLSVSCFICFCFGFYFLLDDKILISLFIRRAFFVVADNHFSYYSFFSDFGHIYFAGKQLFGINLNPFMEYPLDSPVPEIISVFKHGHPYTWVNAGYLATSFMHFGMPGMLFFSVIVGRVLRVIDSFSIRGLPSWVCSAIFIVPLHSLTSTSLFFGALIKGGILFSFVYFWLLSSKNSGKLLNIRIFKKSSIQR